jgi:hypothetical protein
MQHQADPISTDSEGHIAADLGRASGNGEAVATLVQHRGQRTRAPT